MGKSTFAMILIVAFCGIGPCVLSAERNASSTPGSRIDRFALVTRHNVTLNKPDPLTPLSVGNGEFAFTADMTGLQTFPAYHDKGMPLGTLSQWGWHSLPNPEGYRMAEVLEEYEAAGRKVPYASGRARSGGYSPAADWLRANPHRLDLGRIGLRLTKSDGSAAAIEDLANTSQTLDLWTGLLSSRFEFEGSPVRVLTLCHPTRDLLAVRVESPLLGQGRLAVSLAFPYGSADWRVAADWTHPDRHTTQVRNNVGRASPLAQDVVRGRTTYAECQADFTRILDSDRYYVRAAWSEGGRIEVKSQHQYEIGWRGFVSRASRPRSEGVLVSRASSPRFEGGTPSTRGMPSTRRGQDGRDTEDRPLEMVLAFAPTEIAEPMPDFETVRAAAAEHGKRFWMSGGAIDFSACTDPRAAELERRVVLSQYLTAIQCAGSCPPQETGLVHNSWYGKFHLEMHWWHAVHFALWGRAPLLERSLPWYQSILPQAQAAAQGQGYRGARWPKMTSPDGRDSPSEVGVFLIWQQPHPIYFAELCYRAHKDGQTLERYRQVVFETAEFMASYSVWDQAGERYVLGPALIPAQESYGSTRARNLNPTFELAYWHWALEIAQQWRLRLGLEREPAWDRVIQRLSRPTIRDGVYTAIETPPYLVARDHPSLLAAYGFVPATPLIDPNVMKRTLDQVMRTWDWPSTWGWDYPLLAMTAARVGQPQRAVDALFLESPKNRYLANGHNYQSARLPLYLPGNGGLLAAVAMMAAGWDGCPDRLTPGFPDNGKWKVRWEGLRRLP